MGVIISPQFSKRVPSVSKSHFKKMIHSALYEFTMAKCREIMKDETFRALFQLFLDSGAFESFARSDETLSKDIQKFLSCGRYMLSCL